MTNILCDYSTDPVNNPLPFEAITPELFREAAEWAADKARARMKKVAGLKNPDVDSLIENLDGIMREIEVIKSLAYSYATHGMGKAYGEVYEEVAVMASNLSKEMSNNAAIFTSIKKHYERAENGDYNELTKRFIKKLYLDFMQSGAALSKADQKTLQQLDADLSKAASQWLARYTQALDDFAIHITNKGELNGLSDDDLARFERAAKTAGHKQGYLVTLSPSSYSTIMRLCENRDLREKLFKARAKLCYGGPFDNSEAVKEMVQKRLERAKLLGYDSHAELQMEDRMAGKVEAVYECLEEIKKHAEPKAREELKILHDFANKRESQSIKLEPWDISYYQDLYKKENFAFDSDELKQYFELDACMDMLFEHQEKLLGVAFSDVTSDYETLNEDVRVLKAVDKQSGEMLGLVYLDLFERAGKMPGASAIALAARTVKNGLASPATILIRANFTKGADDQGSTLNHGDLETFVHEVGHAMHSLVSTSPYRALAGTSVAADFVELPSQINEKWFSDYDVLKQYAKHSKTGETLPKALLDKMNASKNFGAGIVKMHYLKRCMLDMRFHSENPLPKEDLLAVEKEFTKGLDLFDQHDVYESGRFDHLFDMPYCQYTAGYYVYIWADILAADGFDLFKEKGLYNDEAAQNFRELLASGGTLDAGKLFKAFRGRDADPKALLREIGLVDEEEPASSPANSNESAPKKDGSKKPRVR